MARPTYKVKALKVIQNLIDRGQLQIDGKEFRSASTFICNVALISRPTAAKVLEPETAGEIDLSTAWQIYAGLKANGSTVDFGSGERLVEWSDVFEIVEEDG